MPKLRTPSLMVMDSMVVLAGLPSENALLAIESTGTTPDPTLYSARSKEAGTVTLVSFPRYSKMIA